MTCEPVLPAARAAVFAAVCLGLGVAAHRVMSQAPIPQWALVLGGIGVYVPARRGAGRERGLLGITLLMGVLQVGLHVLFAFAQHQAAASVQVSMPGMATPGAGAGGRMGVGMLVGHALAALVCAWWLRRGEAAVHAVARSAARWIVRWSVAPIRVLPFADRGVRVVLPVEPVAVSLRSQWLLASRALRGPPCAPLFT
jgi:hypothetical protein